MSTAATPILVTGYTNASDVVVYPTFKTDNSLREKFKESLTFRRYRAHLKLPPAALPAGSTDGPGWLVSSNDRQKIIDFFSGQVTQVAGLVRTKPKRTPKAKVPDLTPPRVEAPPPESTERPLVPV